MNILHVSPTFYPATAWGGPIVSTYGLCNALARFTDVQLKVLTTDAAGPSLGDRLSGETPSFEGYDVSYCRRLFGHSGSPELLTRLAGLINWADCVHLTGVFSFPTVPTLSLCRALRRPLVWSPRGSFKDWERNRKPLLKRVWTAACELLIDPALTVLHVTSESERQESLPKLAAAQFKVIRNGIDIPPKAVRQRPFLAEGVMKLLYVGRIHEIKGIERLIGALHLMGNDCNATLTIAGQGEHSYVEKLRQAVREQGLEGSVEFVGFVDGSRKDILFASADACVVPSHTENFGMVVAEALAHGVPVIASTGTPWERLPQIDCGLWVDNTPEALAEAVRRIRTMPLAQMGERGRDWMLGEFGWGSIAHEMRAQYRGLLEARSAR